MPNLYARQVRRLKDLIKGPLYGLYTRRLEQTVRSGSKPNHIAVILDGNRRYFNKVGLKEVSQAYYLGLIKARELVQWCDEIDVPVLTFWILSSDNLHREEAELAGLFKVIREHIWELVGPLGSKPFQRRVQSIGRLELLPPDVSEAIRKAEDSTKHNRGSYLNLAVAYDGREEIVSSVRGILYEGKKRGWSLEEIATNLTTEEIAQHSYTPNLPDPDLIIRTSGEIRLSGFLLWHTVYSEFYFCDALWPEFRKLDLLRAVRSYQQRSRRFGK